VKSISLVIFLTLLFTNLIFASDEKPGKFFENQPDVNDNYQVHFIYFLASESEDREWDINEKWFEQWKK